MFDWEATRFYSDKYFEIIKILNNNNVMWNYSSWNIVNIINQ